MQLDEKVVQDILITKKRISYIKGVLIITLKDLKARLIDQRYKGQVLVLVSKTIVFRLL